MGALAVVHKVNEGEIMQVSAVAYLPEHVERAKWNLAKGREWKGEATE